MKKKQTVQILDSLIQMTQHRDRELMAKTLVKTLHELLGAKKIEFYAVKKSDENVVLSLLARIDPSGLSSRLKKPSGELSEEASQAIVQCIEKQEVIILDLPPAKDRQVIFPVLDDNGETVSLLINHCCRYSPEDQQLTEGIIRLYLNYLSLLEESQRDRLTGLLNRETFISEINKIISSRRKVKSEELYPNSRRRVYSEETYTYWLGLLDIDHFKHINDRYGHLYGDEVLILLVRIMQSSFRKEDLLFRYGGEEFIVVLKVPHKKGAEIAFQRFRKAVAAYKFSQVGQVTVSIGYVQITETDFPLTVVERADKALYYAKENGRNRVVNYEDLVAQGKIIGDEENIEKEGDIELF